MVLETKARHSKTYVRAYPQYGNLANPVGRIESTETILTEDSNSCIFRAASEID